MMAFRRSGSMSAASISCSHDFTIPVIVINASCCRPVKMSAQAWTTPVLGDLDGDGKPEIIVGRNRGTNVKFFKRLRYFEGSSICALSWEGSEMTTLWETKKIPNYTTDYMVGKKNSRTDGFQLFFIESDSSYPLYFWESDSTIINLYEMGRNPDSKLEN